MTNYIVSIVGCEEKFCETFEEALDIFETLKANLTKKEIENGAVITIHETKRVMEAIFNKNATNWKVRRF